MKEIENARKVMREAFDESPEHGGLKETYISGIAMLLYDKYGITDVAKRNQAAEDILQLVFYFGE